MPPNQHEHTHWRPPSSTLDGTRAADGGEGGVRRLLSEVRQLLITTLWMGCKLDPVSFFSVSEGGARMREEITER